MASRGKIAARKRLNARMRIYAACRANQRAAVYGATTIEQFAKALQSVETPKEINRKRYARDLDLVFRQGV